MHNKLYDLCGSYIRVYTTKLAENYLFATRKNYWFKKLIQNLSNQFIIISNTFPQFFYDSILVQAQLSWMLKE